LGLDDRYDWTFYSYPIYLYFIGLAGILELHSAHKERDEKAFLKELLQKEPQNAMQ
jgi:hypothetical protein